MRVVCPLHSIRSVGLAALVLLLAAGCRPVSTPDGLAASMHPVSLIVSPVAGPEVTLATVLPPGVSPHAYDPLPSAVRLASQARLMVAVNPEVDGWVSGLSRSDVFWLHAAPDDPHGWLDPMLVSARVPALVETLCEADVAPCEELEARGTAFQNTLEQLAADMSALQGLTVVLSSNFLTAYAERAGLQVERILAPVEGVEPSPSAVRQAIDVARRAGLVVGQTGFPEIAARRVAEAAEVPFVSVDPVGTPDGTPSYAALIAAITDSLSRP